MFSEMDQNFSEGVQDLDFEIADNSNLVKNQPKQAHRTHPNRPKQQKKLSNRKRNNQRTPQKQNQTNHQPEGRRRRNNRNKKLQNRHANSENDLSMSQPRFLKSHQPGSFKSQYHMQDQRTPSPPHPKCSSRMQAQSVGNGHDGSPVSVRAGSSPLQLTQNHLLNYQGGANSISAASSAGTVYPMQGLQNLQAHQVMPQVVMQPLHGAPNMVASHGGVQTAGFPSNAHTAVLEPHQRLHFQTLANGALPQLNLYQPIHISSAPPPSISSYVSPGPNLAQLSSLQYRPATDDNASLRSEIERLKLQVKHLAAENTNLKSALLHTKNEFVRLHQEAQQKQHLQQQQQMQMSQSAHLQLPSDVPSNHPQHLSSPQAWAAMHPIQNQQIASAVVNQQVDAIPPGMVQQQVEQVTPPSNRRCADGEHYQHQI